MEILYNINTKLKKITFVFLRIFFQTMAFTSNFYCGKSSEKQSRIVV
jgi:hypothetical protein